MRRKRRQCTPTERSELKFQRLLDLRPRADPYLVLRQRGQGADVIHAEINVSRIWECRGRLASRHCTLSTIGWDRPPVVGHGRWYGSAAFNGEAHELRGRSILARSSIYSTSNGSPRSSPK